MQDLRGKRVFVGLSGGVDSAVSAALIKEAGADVYAVFVKGWYPPGMPCTWAEDRRDAMRVAARLQLPFMTLDAREAYKRAVIDYLIKEYGAGRTPNPDVMCNREVKFGVLYAFAQEHGADYLATGHYLDGEKDQRYFLWAIPKTTWKALMFPLKGKTKEEVRALARAYGLPIAEKPDSQGVCFLGDISVDEFLRQTFHPDPGDAYDTEGIRIGRHEGAVLYTLGERIALFDTKQPGPWFVRAKDMTQNRLVVAHERNPQPIAPLSYDYENWIQDPDRAVAAQLRYRGPRIRGIVETSHFIPHELLSEPYAPGQSIVFYDADNALVGGAILS